MRNILLIPFFALLCLSGFCQEEPDTMAVMPEREPERDHSPKKAALLSAALPGLGQVYNGQWWKVPLVYAGLGTTSYFIYFNQREYLNALEALETPNLSQDSLDQFRLDRDFYRRNRDFSIILTGLIYVLNIVDANVYAHLKNFRVTEDLSLKVDPFFYTGNRRNLAGGLTFTLTYK